MSERKRKFVTRSWTECEGNGKVASDFPLSWYFGGGGRPPSSGRRAIPQTVKVAVAVRDGGKCRCVAVACHGWGMCGSTEEPHYDHITAWSKGGTDTVDNLQILCGPCNRRKGADDIT
jgi:hypothetical protein